MPSRKGVFNTSTLQTHNPAVIELARKAGGMPALAEALDIHVTALYQWARGDELPDFDHLVLLGRYKQASDYVFLQTGKTLAQFFNPGAENQQPTFADFEDGSYSPEDELIETADLTTALCRLSKPDMVLLARHAAGWSLSEQGKALGISRWWACCKLHAAQMRAAKLVPKVYRSGFYT